MPRPRQGLALTTAEIEQTFSDPHWAEQFPPVLTVREAAKLAGVSQSTVYDWSSRGRLKQCAVRKGKRLRLYRDRFLKFLFTEEEPA